MEFRKVVHPPLMIIIMLVFASALMLTLAFATGLETSPMSPIFYAIPFYTLVVVCIRTYDEIHPKMHDIKEWFLGIPLVEWVCSFAIVERYRIDILFKSQVRLYFSIAINIGYITINVLAFMLYDSYWFLVIATYYLILFGMCVILFRFDKRVGFGISKMDDLKITRLCAMILLTLNVIVLIAIELVIYSDAGYLYNGILIYLMALYTFFTSGLAVINLIRFSKYGNFVVTIIRMVVVAAALVSILTLEVAMLFQFGSDMSENARELFVIFTGIGISTVIVGMAARIIALSSDEIRELEMQEAVEE